MAKIIAAKDQKVLDIGCGINKVPNTVGIDIDKNSHADIIHDLNVFPYPIADNTFDMVYAKHIIEHVDDPKGFLTEIHRVLKKGGRAFVETPHFSSYVAYSEPQHKLFYSYFLFTNLLRGINFKIIKQEITFYKTFRLFGIKFLANRNPRDYERFWTYLFPAENVTVLVEKN